MEQHRPEKNCHSILEDDEKTECIRWPACPNGLLPTDALSNYQNRRTNGVSPRRPKISMVSGEREQSSGAVGMLLPDAEVYHPYDRRRFRGGLPASVSLLRHHGSSPSSMYHGCLRISMVEAANA